MSLPLVTIDVPIQPNYPIHIGHETALHEQLIDTCRRLAKKWIIITDHTVQSHYAGPLQTLLHEASIPTTVLAFPAGEAMKTRQTKASLEDSMLNQHFGKETGIIALGGGVVTDLAGFLAATYMRGIPCVYYPTTLLAMVDASLGGKTALNTPHGKNLIGCFCQPQAVFINPNTLNTLSSQQLRQGFAEMIKHGLIASKAHFNALYANHTALKAKDPTLLGQMITQSIEIKKRFVVQDPLDQHLRQVLNFGHTMGHAIETCSQYTIAHGDAVAIGMMMEATLSYQRGLLTQVQCQRIKHCLRCYDLPTEAPQNLLQSDHWFCVLRRDKKSRQGDVTCVLLCDIGQYYQHNHQYSVVLDKRECVDHVNIQTQ